MTSTKPQGELVNQKAGRWRLGPRAFVLLVFLAAVIWAGLAIQRSKKRGFVEARKQREAVRAISQAGGVLLYDFEDDSKYVNKNPTDTRTLPVVWLHSIVGADMFTDLVKVHTGPSPTLTITDDTLTHFEQLPQLQMVELTASKITDAGLKHLEGLTQLRWLSLAFTNIDGSGLLHLKGLSQLHSLDLTGTKVTDADLLSLNGATQLRELDLSRTQITDAGLEHLKGLAQLTKLGLRETRVSEAAVSSLQQSIPNCTIETGTQPGMAVGQGGKSSQ